MKALAAVASRPLAVTCRTPLLLGTAALCGLSWGQPGAMALLGLAAAVPVLWRLARARWVAGAVFLVFQLAASRGMPVSTGIFFAEAAPLWFGWLLWAGMAMANALPWYAFWHQGRREGALGLAAALALTTLPPLGVIGWANPLTAAGILFPGLGFAGLLLLVSAWLAVVLGRRRECLVIGLIAIVANLVTAWQGAPAVSGWQGRDTSYGQLGSGPQALLGAYGRIQDLQELASELAPRSVLVLPETLLGRYTDATARRLAPTIAELQAKHSVVLVGAERINATGQLDNVLLALGDDAGAIEQRVPIPVGMWRPWSADSFAMHLEGRGVAMVAGRRIAALICYEQLLTFPVLASMVAGADLLVGAANDWWARDTSAPVIQQQALQAWGRLFAVPVVSATNL